MTSRNSQLRWTCFLSFFKACKGRKVILEEAKALENTSFCKESMAVLLPLRLFLYSNPVLNFNIFPCVFVTPSTNSKNNCSTSSWKQKMALAYKRLLNFPNQKVRAYSDSCTKIFKIHKY